MLPTREQALVWAQDQLKGGESPKLDSEIILAHGLDCTRASLIAWPEQPLSEDHWHGFQKAIKRRQLGEPVAYIIGEQGFWTLTLKTNPSTLIPRPETELLVEQVLSMTWPEHNKLLDLGTGTGAIGLALASENPQWQIMGVDLNPEAVDLANQNAQLNSINNIRFEQGSWAENVEPGWDCIVSNPPYIDPKDAHIKQGDLRFEPLSALVAEDAGLADIKTIAKQAWPLLNKNGWLLFEHGYNQGAQVREILLASGFDAVQTKLDYGQRERITFGQKPT
ncbi:MAG: peptide chain release factor N(5)-glutamine methyltransferase [Pseudomonadales bacterium]